MLGLIFNSQAFRALVLIWIIPYFALASHCTVSKISIIPGSWENTSTKTSYIVQTQDSNGESCHTSQTLRLSFESSAEGSFSGQQGSPVQAWISSNSANRNFYYNHATGNYVITVKAGYGPADGWDVLFTTSHNSYEGISNNNPSASNMSSSIKDSENNIFDAPISSAHYDSTVLSVVRPKAVKEFGAGRDRIGSVGSPVEFNVETDEEYNRKYIFKWNFGDGNEGNGDMVTHTYEYPGEYVVVLNTSFPGGQAISRTNVKIIKPEISIVFANTDRIEIKNNSKHEISLFGQVVTSKGASFVFPQDSIIKSGQSISFSSRLTGLSPLNSSDVAMLAIGESARQNNVISKIEEEKTKKMAQIKNEISILQNQLTSIYKQQNLTHSTAGSNVSSEKEPDLLENNKTSLLTASVEGSVSASDSVNTGNWLQIFKHFFLRTR